jgi:glutamate N-acetyltransferase/amino-acid N-acetyltransferase
MITALPRGYLFAGVHCGIRSDPNRRDLALIVSTVPAAAAGVFTQNRVCAAPVQVSRQRVPTANARGVVVCSGNANACTGEKGLQDARQMAAVAASAIGCSPEQMLVSSTGIIGRHLPMPSVEQGIRAAANKLQSDHDSLSNVAHAILTTDTRIKLAHRTIPLDDQEIRLLGIAKGAAMIGPNMATMLAFVLTDARVAPGHLQTLLRQAADRTFNCISVEGHTSTNDTLLLFANGMASGEVAQALTPREPPREPTRSELAAGTLVQFGQAVTEVCADLARAIADDAEGISHLITIDVEGLRTEAEARQVAKTVAESALVKTAIFGADPNWGRIVSAAGYAGVEFAERDLSLWLGDMLLYDQGTPQRFDAAAASAYLKNHREICMRLAFSLGSARCRFWTCDLGYEYVRLNAEYTT